MTDSTERFRHCALLPNKNYRAAFVGENPELVDGRTPPIADDPLSPFSVNPVMRERVRVRQRFLDEKHILLADAHEDGRVEGLAEGEAKKNCENATAMKQEGFDTAVISRITGLSPAEIEQLN